MSRPSPRPHGASRAALFGALVRVLLCVLLCASLTACEPYSPLLEDLDERQALAIASLLDAHQVPSAREPSGDPKGRGRWRLRVPDHDLTTARALLRAYGLPAPPPPVALDGDGVGAPLSLLPSADDARTQRLRAQQRALEDTLGALSGVTYARVHLSDAADSAAVLLRVTPDADPNIQAEAARLLTYAVPSVEAARAHVTAQVVQAVAPAPLVKLGPWHVARGDAAGLQRLLIALIVCAVMGLSAAVWFGWRLRRATASPHHAPAPPRAVTTTRDLAPPLAAASRPQDPPAAAPVGMSPAGMSPPQPPPQTQHGAARQPVVAPSDAALSTARPLAQPHAPIAPR